MRIGIWELGVDWCVGLLVAFWVVFGCLSKVEGGLTMNAQCFSDDEDTVVFSPLFVSFWKVMRSFLEMMLLFSDFLPRRKIPQQPMPVTQQDSAFSLSCVVCPCLSSLPHQCTSPAPGRRLVRVFVSRSKQKVWPVASGCFSHPGDRSQSGTWFSGAGSG